MLKNLPDRIFLCGFMGAGKSTIGKALATHLQQTFLDLDEFIESEEGASIPQMFKQEGEAAFRKAERAALLKVIRIFEGIVALGGGSLQNQHVVDHVKLNGLLIFIETPFSIIFKRIITHANRPLLLNEEGKPRDTDILKEEMKQLYEQRRPLYEQAVITINTKEYPSIDMQIEQLVRKIKNHVSHN